jgi:hypothetical protein
LEPVPLEKEAAVLTWMQSHGWKEAHHAGSKIDPGFGFHTWRGLDEGGNSVRLEVGNITLRALDPSNLVQLLTRLGVADELRSKGRARVGQEGSKYRLLPLPQEK